jgi:hypothetical protein
MGRQLNSACTAVPHLHGVEARLGLQAVEHVGDEPDARTHAPVCQAVAGTSCI